MSWYETADSWLGGILPYGAPLSPIWSKAYSVADNSLLGILPGGKTPFQAVGEGAADVITPIIQPLLPVLLVAGLYFMDKK